MLATPRANRLSVAFFGKRNVGKSSLINALTGQNTALVSSVPGSTSDPIYKNMEIPPLGPVTFIDTAGLDDIGFLGQNKIKRSQKILENADVLILICDATETDKSWEISYLKKLYKKTDQILIVENKIDLLKNTNTAVKPWANKNFKIIKTSANSGEGLEEVKKELIKLSFNSVENNSLIASLFPENSLFFLVTTKDPQAPKGRLILPQVQVLRDILEHHGLVFMCGIEQLPKQIALCSSEPALVITDAQIFKQVAEIIPKNWFLTAFSIIMAKAKGNLEFLIEGTKKIEKLNPESKILISESCTHHALKNDIAREQIPKLLKQKYGNNLKFNHINGQDFPENLNEYDLIISCGSCMLSRKQFLNIIAKASKVSVPISNFGLTLAYLNNYLSRAIDIFKS